MQTAKVQVVCWQDDGWWLGYLKDYPDFWTQGESVDDLLDHLKDLYRELSAGDM